MGWLERIRGDEDPRISDHHMTAGMAEWGRGAITKTQAKNTLNLTDDDANELQIIVNNVIASTYSRELVEDVLSLCQGQFYNIATTRSRLQLP